MFRFPGVFGPVGGLTLGKLKDPWALLETIGEVQAPQWIDRGGKRVQVIDAEDYGRWHCLWDQLSLLIARLKLLEEHKINSVDSLLEINALVLDIEATQSFVRLTAESESDIASPRIIELQEKTSLKLANLEIVARKLKSLPGTPGPLNVEPLKGFRQELSDTREELESVVTAAFQRLKLK